MGEPTFLQQKSKSKKLGQFFQIEKLLDKGFLAIRRAISLNETFILFCRNKAWRYKAHLTITNRPAVYAPLHPSPYI